MVIYVFLDNYTVIKKKKKEKNSLHYVGMSVYPKNGCKNNI